MTKSELKRLAKIEDRIYQIATDFGLEFTEIDFSIVPDQKMLEIMAYNIPTNISNWKRGRDYERLKTIHEMVDPSLPYEVVLNTDPARAYLMKSNTFAVQALVMAHVVGHVAFFTMNNYFKNTKKDIIEYMASAQERINSYEKKYGIDDVEKTIDAGDSIKFHSSPFENETESEKIKRIYEQERKKRHSINKSQFNDILNNKDDETKKEDIERYNQKLLRELKLKSPIEPTEDFLRFIIDNSVILEDWQKDILEVLREEGRYYWPIIKTKFMNEGFAVYIHEYIMNKLFHEGLLDGNEHGQFNYSNSLVKAKNLRMLNPYHIGSEIWKDIVERWDKGKYGPEWENCESIEEKENWDTKEMNGHKKMFNVLKNYNDWFFFQEFLTQKLVYELELFLYTKALSPEYIYDVIVDTDLETIKNLIINAFAQNIVPKIEITNGNHQDKGFLFLSHRYSGAPLDEEYAKKTLKHISFLWGKTAFLRIQKDKDTYLTISSN